MRYSADPQNVDAYVDEDRKPRALIRLADPGGMMSEWKITEEQLHASTPC